MAAWIILVYVCCRRAAARRAGGLPVVPAAARVPGVGAAAVPSGRQPARRLPQPVHHLLAGSRAVRAFLRLNFLWMSLFFIVNSKSVSLQNSLSVVVQNTVVTLRPTT